MNLLTDAFCLLKGIITPFTMSLQRLQNMKVFLIFSMIYITFIYILNRKTRIGRIQHCRLYFKSGFVLVIRP